MVEEKPSTDGWETMELREQNRERSDVEIVVSEPLLDTTAAPTEEKKMTWKDSCMQTVVWKCQLWMVIVSIFLFIIIITTISLVLYSVVYIDEDETLNLDSPFNQNYTGTIRVINPCIHSKMLLSEPEENNSVSDKIKKRITEVYKSSPALRHYFISADVISFSEENTTASYTLEFSVPTEGSFLKYTMSEEFVSGVLRQDIYDQEESECKSVMLDASSMTLSSL
ncbi:TPA-induced transmembrane protein isoform X2 [Microcaecilia unicolor]|uniref:TPA-induced transmembrane protein isoform X2 n=1 Tax=Microcaecilia unicolor TaxID=1415580 RepID=A0A6P7Y565_9AMPH|nr:TPA-induced transmembrane protein isoform X2 [Microcaecilia unicolor]